MILDCACCGGAAPALAQWHNRDQGYGVCARCFDEVAAKEGIERAIDYYGKPGIHHESVLGLPIKAMREWASDCQWLDGEDLDQYSDSQIARGVARHYAGGITQFIKDAEPVRQ